MADTPVQPALTPYPGYTPQDGKTVVDPFVDSTKVKVLGMLPLSPGASTEASLALLNSITQQQIVQLLSAILIELRLSNWLAQEVGNLSSWDLDGFRNDMLSSDPTSIPPP